MDPSKAIAPAYKYRIVCVISGPEPQRTLLEEELMRQLPSIEGRHLLVRGKPEPALDETIDQVDLGQLRQQHVYRDRARDDHEQGARFDALQLYIQCAYSTYS